MRIIHLDESDENIDDSRTVFTTYQDALLDTNNDTVPMKDLPSDVKNLRMIDAISTNDPWCKVADAAKYVGLPIDSINLQMLVRSCMDDDVSATLVDLVLDTARLSSIPKCIGVYKIYDDRGTSVIPNSVEILYDYISIRYKVEMEEYDIDMNYSRYDEAERFISSTDNPDKDVMWEYFNSFNQNYLSSLVEWLKVEVPISKYQNAANHLVLYYYKWISSSRILDAGTNRLRDAILGTTVLDPRMCDRCLFLDVHTSTGTHYCDRAEAFYLRMCSIEACSSVPFYIKVTRPLKRPVETIILDVYDRNSDLIQLTKKYKLLLCGNIMTSSDIMFMCEDNLCTEEIRRSIDATGIKLETYTHLTDVAKMVSSTYAKHSAWTDGTELYLVPNYWTLCNFLDMGDP
ncbi:hypothetical protein HDU85_005893 [Gaertneriomyces sp. JEL0708]|nr:hypothetical protein HDU85_005893 [Gaertneriomyces sp. JEL0708]